MAPQFNPKSGLCVTADYGVYGPHNISVANRERLYSPKGEIQGIDGYAIQNSNPKKTAELEVYFAGFGGGAYWIVDIGPQTYTEDAICSPCYQYSVVSNEFGLDLYVLARDVTLFNQQFNATLYSKLIQQGFTHDYNRPLETYQSDACEYPPLPEYYDY